MEVYNVAMKKLVLSLVGLLLVAPSLLLMMPTTAAFAGTTGNPPAAVCDVGSFSWLACPAITLGNIIVNSIYKDIVIPLLTLSPFNTNVQVAWKAVASLADVAFVIIFLIIIFGTSFGLDSYTIKKVLPRLIIAAILVQFSFFISGLIIDIGNVAGDGISQLIGSVLNDGTTNTAQAINGWGAAADAVLGVGAVAILGFGFVGFALLAGILGLLTMMVTLILRQIVITALIVLSPLAFVAFVLPNTNNYFKMWLKNLVKLSLMYPLIALMIGSARLLSGTPLTQSNLDAAAKTASATSIPGAAAAPNLVIRGIFTMLPIFAFFAIPMTFKAAGSVMGTVSGQLAKRSRGFGSTAAAGRATQPAKDLKTNFDRNRLEARKTYGLGVGSAAKTRRNQRLEGARAEQVKQKQLGHAGMSSEDLTKLGQSDNAIDREAAIGTLASKADTGALEKIFNNDRYVGNSQNQEWKRAVSPHFSTLNERAPHLVRNEPPDAAKGTAGTNPYNDLSAERMTTLDKTGWEALRTHARTDSSTHSALIEKINRIDSSAPLTNKLTDSQRSQLDSLRGEVSWTSSSSSSPGPASPPVGGPPTPPPTGLAP
jgi:hypothetical protein